MAYVAGGIIENEHFNAFIADVIEVWGDSHNGATVENPANFGYGQYHALVNKNDGDIVTANDWDSLITIVKTSASLQNSTIGSLPAAINIGNVITAMNALSAAITTIRTNRLNIPENRLRIPSTVGTDLSSNRSGAWGGKIKHEFSVQFQNWDNMRYYFNSGGQIRMSPRFASNSTTTHDLAWKQIFNGINTIKFSHTQTVNEGTFSYTNNTGFYNLTVTPQVVFTNTVSGVTFSVSAWISGPPGIANTIIFRLEWDSSTLVSTGNITSNVDLGYVLTPLTILKPTINNLFPLSNNQTGDPYVDLALSKIPTSTLERESEKERNVPPVQQSFFSIQNIYAMDFDNVAISDPESITLTNTGIDRTYGYVYDVITGMEILTAENKYGTVKLYRDPSDRYNVVRNLEINTGDVQADSIFTFTYNLTTKTGKTISKTFNVNVSNRMLSWESEAKLTYLDTTADAGEQTGASVAVSHNGVYVLSGAPSSNNAAGAVYMYKLSGTQYLTIPNLPLPPANIASDQFGFSLACADNANYVIVSSPYKTVSGKNCGQVYIYKQTTNDVWTLSSTINPPSPENGMEFGYDVDISDDGVWAVIGAPSQNSGTVTKCGAVYVYRRTLNSDIWTLQSTFLAQGGLSEADVNSKLGYSVAISGKDLYNTTNYAGYTIVAGKPFKQNGSSVSAGTVQVYENTTGSFSFLQQFNNPTANDLYGFSVDISTRGDHIVIGAPQILTGGAVPPTVVQTISTITNPSVSEGGTLVFSVALSGASATANTYPITINVGTATAGVDFDATLNNSKFNNGVTYDGGFITVPANITNFNLSLETYSDVSSEGTETFTITIGDKTATATILSVAVSAVSNVTVVEGDSAVHSVTLSGVPTVATNFTISLSSGTGVNGATAGVDFTQTLTNASFNYGVTISGNTITVPAGVSLFHITVNTTQDSTYEGAESYTINVGGVTATGTITNDDVPTDYVGSTLFSGPNLWLRISTDTHLTATDRRAIDSSGNNREGATWGTQSQTFTPIPYDAVVANVAQISKAARTPIDTGVSLMEFINGYATFEYFDYYHGTGVWGVGYPSFNIGTEYQILTGANLLPATQVFVIGDEAANTKKVAYRDINNVYKEIFIDRGPLPAQASTGSGWNSAESNPTSSPSAWTRIRILFSPTSFVIKRAYNTGWNTWFTVASDTHAGLLNMTGATVRMGGISTQTTTHNLGNRTDFKYWNRLLGDHEAKVYST